ncbi:DUF4376 domain-containing protein [Cronobacter sp. EKM101R]|uniref:DUF4376 domain-containing protein n=1 Tax=Cronobacter TaxID=413496 RepID=UPI0013ED6C7E|nr:MULTISPECIES: DUF4376 domain-containing protein [Cronobacter]KAF6592437.1 DUF4376 domain-containing protein [Cronobacter sp. EKM101R]KAF6595034.1 DUF4376 domain-containing protein [Cronobacter sp. EKM102R]MDK1186534.1 DUF4376 domain-containing protein [Cronobacter turicensis]MDK1206915.1 DUF4376 domain-containing protein [Cronobacter turicensis]MDK1216777.1 DUF4376 domain-containing protein [Cronobacter turicensis]
MEAVNFITAVRNAAYNEYGAITCEVQFEGTVDARGEPVWSPFTATSLDVTDYGRQLYHALVNGEYGEIPPFVATPEMLERARAARREEINLWRDQQENIEYLMEFNGRRWDFGKRTKERISTSLTVARSGQLPDGFAWTDGDNNIVPVTAAELLALGDAIELAMFNKGVEINTRQLQMKAEVCALQTLEEIRNYRVGWPIELV